MKFVYELKSNVFFYDVFYGIFITFYCPVLYFIGNVYGTSLSFFLASVTAFLIYTIVLKKEKIMSHLLKSNLKLKKTFTIFFFL